MSAQQVAEHFGIAERTVRRWITSGQLDAQKVGRAFSIRFEDAEALVNSALGRRATARQDELERERSHAILEGRLAELRDTVARLEIELRDERRRNARLELLVEGREAA